LCIAKQEGLHGDENNQLRLGEWEALDEKRLQPQQSWNATSIQQEGLAMAISSR